MDLNKVMELSKTVLLKRPEVSDLEAVALNDPLLDLFKEVVGVDYFTAKHETFYRADSSDPYMGNKKYIKCFARLIFGLEELYWALFGQRIGYYPSKIANPKSEKKLGRALIKDIEEKIGHPIKFLELGGGTCINSFQAANLGMEVYAVELREELLRFTRIMLEKGQMDGRIDPDAKVKLFRGNFLPKEFIEKIRNSSLITTTLSMVPIHKRIFRELINICIP